MFLLFDGSKAGPNLKNPRRGGDRRRRGAPPILISNLGNTGNRSNAGQRRANRAARLANR